MAGRLRRSGTKVVRLVGPPAAPERIRPTVETLPSGGVLYRIYSPAPYGTKALTFRTHGPHLRFDHHRHPIASPAVDRRRGILYAALEPTCCFGEVFNGAITLAGYRIARLELRNGLRILDLRGSAATGVGTIAAIGSEGARGVTQAWARYLYDHPDLDGIDGLLY